MILDICLEIKRMLGDRTDRHVLALKKLFQTGPGLVSGWHGIFRAVPAPPRTFAIAAVGAGAIMGRTTDGFCRAVSSSHRKKNGQKNRYEILRFDHAHEPTMTGVSGVSDDS